jgi:hypothetical protein
MRELDNLVMVERKSVERLASVHARPLLTCLKLTNVPVGLRANFGAATLREGLHRPALPRLRVNQAVPETRGFAASLTPRALQ